MALNNFIPTVWSARLLAALSKALVYGQAGIVNRDYEGEIRAAGDSVKINSIGDVTVKTYTKDTDIDNPEVLNDGSMMLKIDQQKYFNFAVDDIDMVQTKPKVVDEAMSRSAYKLRDVADQYIASFHTEVPTANLVGDDVTPIAALAANAAYEHLVNLSIKLDEANIPTEGRFAIIPPFFHGALLKDDRFVKYGGTNQEATLRNGQVGEAAGFRILKSNNVPNTAATKYKIIAGHDMAFSFAEQIVKVEAYRKEKGFSDGVKGLHVYGGKLVRPYAWAVGTVNNAAS